MSANFIKFVGNRPKNVAKEAKYSVRFENGEYVVGLYYQAPDDETWYPTSHAHPELVERINAIKTYFNGAPGGAFYINEYKQVLVPVRGEDDYYYAGEYATPLVFEFEGKTLSGQAADLDGRPLEVGDLWDGPHPGIPYVLKAGGKDISYRYILRPGVEKEVKLSKCIGIEQAKAVAQNINRLKGYAGGRFYVNEYGNIFAPKTGEYGIDYFYLGQIDYDNWFPKPDIGAEETAATD